MATLISLWVSVSFLIFLCIRNTEGQVAKPVTIAATATSNGQRYMPAGSILATVTVTGGTPPLTFVDPVNDRFFKVLKATPSTTGNQAWIINRVPFGLGKYVVPVTATDSKGVTGTQTTEITIT